MNARLFLTCLNALLFVSFLQSGYSQTVDAAVVWGKQEEWTTKKTYFFQNDQYFRYDRTNEKVDQHYPLSIQKYWGFPAGFTVDAAVNWGNGKAYFFSGDQYIRYDIKAGKTDPGYPVKISKYWNLPTAFQSNIDAALNMGNGKAYFFKGDQYIRYDIKAGKVDPGYPVKISKYWNLPSGFHKDIDAAINWGNGKLYFFKGDQYVRFDIKTDRTDNGYPLMIQRHWNGITKIAAPYQLVFTLDQLKVNTDGDGGVDKGDLFWTIKFNNKTISARKEDETIDLGSGNTYAFSSIKNTNETLTYTYAVNNKKASFPISASFADVDGGLRGGTDDFGTGKGVHLLTELLVNPGQRSLRVSNAKGDVELFYTIIVKKWNGNRYVQPDYPRWTVPASAQPDEELPFLIGLQNDEIDQFQKIMEGDAAMNSLNLGQKVSEIGKKLKDLPNTNASKLEAASYIGGISIEATIDFAAAGPVGAGVGIALFGTINAITQPLIFSSTNYNNTIFVANYSDKPLKIKDRYQYSGTYTYGPKDGVIPGRTADKVYVGVFVFEKKFGLFGTEGALEFGTYGDMPKIQFGYSLPYRDEVAIRHKNKCAVSVGNNMSIEDFYNKQVGFDSSTPIADASSKSKGIRASARISSTDAEFTQMFVAIQPD